MKNKLVLSSLNHTWIFDIDGTIAKHNGYKLDGYDTLLDGVKDFFDQIPLDDMIILITSREEKYKEETEKFLKTNSIRYDHIICGAPYGERIIVNDNKPSGLEMSKSLCLERDKGIDLEMMIDEKL